MEDQYKTILRPSTETLFKEKGSKFFGYAYPVQNQDDVEQALQQIRRKHPTARHCCYAWQLGLETQQFRVNDDGEPSYTAGMPIYGQIQSFGLTNVLVVSVRYFGGTKLGVGGLIQAYKTSAKMAIEASAIAIKTINITYELRFDYEQMNQVMRLVKEHQLNIVKQDMQLRCQLQFEIRKSEASRIEEILSSMHKIAFEKLIL